MLERYDTESDHVDGNDVPDVLANVLARLQLAATRPNHEPDYDLTTTAGRLMAYADGHRLKWVDNCISCEFELRDDHHFFRSKAGTWHQVEAAALATSLGTWSIVPRHWWEGHEFAERLVREGVMCEDAPEPIRVCAEFIKWSGAGIMLRDEADYSLHSVRELKRMGVLA